MSLCGEIGLEPGRFRTSFCTSSSETSSVSAARRKPPRSGFSYFPAIWLAKCNEFSIRSSSSGYCANRSLSFCSKTRKAWPYSIGLRRPKSNLIDIQILPHSYLVSRLLGFALSVFYSTRRLRVDNGPEILSSGFIAWAQSTDKIIQYIQKTIVRISALQIVLPCPAPGCPFFVLVHKPLRPGGAERNPAVTAYGRRGKSISGRAVRPLGYSRPSIECVPATPENGPIVSTH